MRRGFKADAERRAVSARAELGLPPTGPLCPWIYAAHLGVLVFEARDLALPAEHMKQLLVRDPDSWSGMTLAEDGVHLVVLNSAQSRARRAATLMHEIAHISLDHAPSEVSVSPSGLVLLSDYSADQEDEADWLGGALLLPEPALLHHRGQGTPVGQIAAQYGVSEQLCTWRCRMTGVEKRMAFKRRA
jgi:Zn-dependent peptidase ImmA (M78 family)